MRYPDIRELKGSLPSLFVAGVVSSIGRFTVHRKKEFRLTISVRAKNLPLLEEVMTAFGNVGSLYELKNKFHTYWVYRVSNKLDLAFRVIPVVDGLLIGETAAHFEIWKRELAEQFSKMRHLTRWMKHMKSVEKREKSTNPPAAKPPRPIIGLPGDY